jgi:hypothetical protein
MSFVYIGFDLVPKKLPISSEKWSTFIADVSSKYENDGVLSRDLFTLKFALGGEQNNPKLPLSNQGEKFRRFCIGYNGNKNKKLFKKSLSYVKGLFQLAQKHFGEEQVKFFDEGIGEFGHYGWQEVQELEATYGIPLLNEGRGSGCDGNGAVVSASRDGGEGSPGFRPGQVIQKWVEPFVKVLVGNARGKKR